ISAIGTYNHLGEDAFITFRYVRNLASGVGFVYNPGEFVEGYSNFFWAILLLPFEAAGLNIHISARFISTLAIAVAAVGAWVAARKIMEEKTPAWLALWLPLAIAVEPLLRYHNDRGLETVFFAAMLALAIFSCASK